MRKYFINCFNKIKNRNGKHEQNYRNERKKKDILFNTNKYVSTSLPEDLC